MSDIFISYKREDRARAQRIRQALKELGFSVWWDCKILHGRTFDRVIREALGSTSCVIVLWSKASVESDWVRDEAEEGLRRDILIPVLIERVPIPLGFGRLQTADLSDWGGERTHPEFVKLTRSVAAMLGHEVEETRYDLQVLPPASKKCRHRASRRAGHRARRPRPWRLAMTFALAFTGTSAAYLAYEDDWEPAGLTALRPAVVEWYHQARDVLDQASGWALAEYRAATAGSPQAETLFAEPGGHPVEEPESPRLVESDERLPFEPVKTEPEPFAEDI